MDEQEIEISIKEIDSESLKKAVLDAIENIRIAIKAKITFVFDIESN